MLSSGTSNENAVVIFSGGQDSTICLLQAIEQRGRNRVRALTFQYGQRHSLELECAAWIARDLGVVQTVLELPLLPEITSNALMEGGEAIQSVSGRGRG